MSAMAMIWISGALGFIGGVANGYLFALRKFRRDHSNSAALGDSVKKGVIRMRQNRKFVPNTVELTWSNNITIGDEPYLLTLTKDNSEAAQ